MLHFSTLDSTAKNNSLCLCFPPVFPHCVEQSHRSWVIVWAPWQHWWCLSGPLYECTDSIGLWWWWWPSWSALPPYSYFLGARDVLVLQKLYSLSRDKQTLIFAPCHLTSHGLHNSVIRLHTASCLTPLSQANEAYFGFWHFNVQLSLSLPPIHPPFLWSPSRNVISPPPCSHKEWKLNSPYLDFYLDFWVAISLVLFPKWNPCI